MSATLVRLATLSDLPAAAAMAGQLVRQHHAQDPGRFLLVDEVEAGYRWWFERELARSGEAILLVATQDGRHVGYAYGTKEGRDWNMLLDDHGAIHDIFVATEARKSGVGKALLEALVTRLESLGASRIVLSTMVSNTAAQALFRTLGFRPTMLEMTRGPSQSSSP